MARRATKRGEERTDLSGSRDVLICGASFAGLMVARQLAGSGADVLLIDRYEIGERQSIDLPHFIANPGDVFSMVRSAGVFYGGLILAVVVGLWYMRRHGLPIWTTADLFAPAERASPATAASTPCSSQRSIALVKASRACRAAGTALSSTGAMVQFPSRTSAACPTLK